jgi:hypothetical protein
MDETLYNQFNHFDSGRTLTLFSINLSSSALSLLAT